jgi:hypothetical protein
VISDPPEHRVTTSESAVRRRQRLRVLPLRLRRSWVRCATSPPAPTSRSWCVTVGAINKFGDETTAAEEANQSAKLAKSKNKMYLPSEKTGGERPIDLVMATRPILIVDEPQSRWTAAYGRARGAKLWSAMRAALHAALLRHARREAPHGLPA